MKDILFSVWIALYLIAVYVFLPRLNEKEAVFILFRFIISIFFLSRAIYLIKKFQTL